MRFSLQAAFCAFLLSLCHVHGDDLPHRILFLAHKGNHEEALRLYIDKKNSSGTHDFRLLREMAIGILEQGANSKDGEIQRAVLFAAGVSSDERTLPILVNGLQNPDPNMQLFCLNIIATQLHDEAQIALRQTMRTASHPILRLIATFVLAQQKDPLALTQAESFYNQVPDAAHVLFPQIFTQFHNKDATKYLRKLLNHPLEEVRVEAILNVVKGNHEELLGQIRMLASHPQINQLETSAYALGEFRDEKSISRLTAISQMRHATTALAGLIALYEIGVKDSYKQVAQMANEGNLFAIYALGVMPESKQQLIALLQHPSPDVRLNACISLLEMRDPSGIPLLSGLLLRDTRDLGIDEIASPGRSLHCLKIIPSVSAQPDAALLHEISLRFKEQLLAQTLDLPEEHFLSIAEKIVESEENELVPAMIDMIVNHQSTKGLEFLKKYREKAGAPLIRTYCNLALYKLQEEGPYRDQLFTWIRQHFNDSIDFRMLQPLDGVPQFDDLPSKYKITPTESSRLFIEILEAFNQYKDPEGIDLLVELIQQSPPKKRYPLAGILLHVTQ